MQADLEDILTDDQTDYSEIVDLVLQDGTLHVPKFVLMLGS